MFRNLSLKLTKGSGLVIAVAAAAIVGGATSAVVMAAIPSSGGTISACYSSNGALKVLDAESGATCGVNTTPLSWSQGSSNSAGSPQVKDANGQTLGSLLSSHELTGSTEVFTAILKRIIPVGVDSNYPGTTTSEKLAVGQATTQTLFTTANCSGQAYISQGEEGGANSIGTIGAKTLLWRYGGSQSSETHAIVSDATQAQTITSQSQAFYDDSGHYTCRIESFDSSVYPLTTVSLPFTTPVTLPLQF
jgi:hypothetical protein